MVIVGHLVSFIMGKCQRQMRSAWITPASVWSYRFPDSLVIARRQRRDDQGGGEMGRKMHAEEARNSRLPACTRRQIARRQHRDGHAGGETE